MKQVTESVTETERDPRWKCVLARDPASDGEFVYGVKTSGVYCRPSCPSRRAKPHNVTFYRSAEDAEAAGFRACLRCHPKGQSSAEANAAIVAEACRIIEQADEMLHLDDLAARVGMSPHYFHRQFKAITGVTPRAYASAHRAGRVRAELPGSPSVTDAINAAGFNASSRFYEQSSDMLGMPPSAYRKGGKDAEIRFAVGQCTLGAILVAQSNRGICAISLGDDPDALVRELQDRFPLAHLIGDDSGFASLIAKVVGFIEAPRIGLDLPLDIQGTTFQIRVWQALREIPVGQTASYSDIASRIGAPRAVRAVAAACAANRIAVAIPCHRVVRADGSLSGYRWGVPRKCALLEKEARE